MKPEIFVAYMIITLIINLVLWGVLFYPILNYLWFQCQRCIFRRKIDEKTALIQKEKIKSWLLKFWLPVIPYYGFLFFLLIDSEPEAQMFFLTYSYATFFVYYLMYTSIYLFISFLYSKENKKKVYSPKVFLTAWIIFFIRVIIGIILPMIIFREM